MSNPILDLFLEAAWQTFAMVGISSLIALFAGVPLAVILVITAPGGLWEQRAVNRALGAVINGFRSTPFIILLVALLPITRLIVGTTIGTAAAIVPLAIAATPFFARVAEVSLREVDKGLIEAAQAMGARKVDIVWHVLLPEALPSLIAGFTLTIITLIGASAMAGAVGAGGLGDLAIRYGYQRFETDIMLGVIAVLIALVALVQLTGDRLAARVNKRA